MNAGHMVRIVAILDKQSETIKNLIDRIEDLERTVSEQDETIRGLTTDTGQNSEEVNNLRVEFDRLSGEVDRLYENPNA